MSMLLLGDDQRGFEPRGYGIAAAQQSTAGYQDMLVTSADDDGRGTFREALMTPGNRIIRTNLPSTAEVVWNSPISAAPGNIWFDAGGSLFTTSVNSVGSTQSSMLGFDDSTNKLSIHNARFIPPHNGNTNYDTVNVGETSPTIARDIYFRNCTFMHASDEVMSLNHTDNITVDRCVVAFACAGHRGGNNLRYGSLFVSCNNLTLIESLYACNHWRNPRVTIGPFRFESNVEIINSVNYGHSSGGIILNAHHRNTATEIANLNINVVGNVNIHGPSGPRFSNGNPTLRHIVLLGTAETAENNFLNGTIRLHETDNHAFESYGGATLPWTTSLSGGYDIANRTLLAEPEVPLTVDPMTDPQLVLDTVINNAGAMPQDPASLRFHEERLRQGILADTAEVINFPAELDHRPVGDRSYFRPRNTGLGPDLELVAVGTEGISLRVNDNDGVPVVQSWPNGTTVSVYGTDGRDGVYSVTGDDGSGNSVLEPVDAQETGDRNQTTDKAFGLHVEV